MILVDTSVWIELLNGRLGARVREEDLLDFATCAPIVQELLQGFLEDARREAFREGLLSLPILSNPLPIETFLSAAEIYREGRVKSYTIRSSTDCLIAAIAISNNVPVWHKDRDFDAISRFTPLRVRRSG